MAKPWAVIDWTGCYVAFCDSPTIAFNTAYTLNAGTIGDCLEYDVERIDTSNEHENKDYEFHWVRAPKSPCRILRNNDKLSESNDILNHEYSSMEGAA